MGWVAFIRHLQHPSDVHPDIAKVPHPATGYLARLSHYGVPAPSKSPPWSQATRKSALQRGAHISASQHFREFLHEDMADYIKKRFWVVLPYAAVQHMPHLKLSPCGVVTQRERRPRPIIDYTALQRGAHISASQHFREFLHEDMADYIKKRFWVVLPYAAVQHMPHLKLSPCGVVPQRERRPRPIIDYTFSGINQQSVPLAPTESMQFGTALQRILQRIAYADPRFGPVHMLKFDLSDGYYRVRLSPEAALEMAVIIPGDTPKSNLIAVPLSLPMGRALSPPYFCAYTETSADIANHALRYEPDPTTIDPLELQSQQPIVPVPSAKAVLPDYLCPPGRLLSAPLQRTDVYMDDFIALAQHPNLQRTLHHTLKGILSVFRDNSHPADPPDRKHIISQTKMAKGDAAWSTKKVILGWLLNSSAGALSLQPHKVNRLCTIVQEFHGKQRTSKKKWQSLLGELRHMAPALQGTRYLFSVLQHVLKDQPTAARLRLSPLVKQTLLDWKLIASDLAAHPVPVASLVPRPPHFAGAVDASGSGCGGFWVNTAHGTLPQPLAFRHEFPPDIQTQLVSSSNPSGTLSNSDFELAAIALGVAIIQDNAPT
jgi:hypothetical protein